MRLIGSSRYSEAAILQTDVIHAVASQKPKAREQVRLAKGVQCGNMQVGTLGGKDAESSFSCPTCNQPLSAAQVFTASALKKARGEAEGLQPGQGVGRGQGGWQSSSKVEHLLELLRAMQHRGATGYGPAVHPLL